MTSLEFHSSQRRARSLLTAALTQAAVRWTHRAIHAVIEWRRQRRDRAAFLHLIGKEDWVYRDMGIHRGDVEWASRLPLHVNAAQELEKLRARYNMGR